MNVKESEKEAFRNYYYQQYGKEYDLKDPVFPLFYEVYKLQKRNQYQISTTEAAKAFARELQTEKFRFYAAALLVITLTVSTVCATYHFLSPAKAYSEFLENATVETTPDGRTKYIRLETTEKGKAVLGKHYLLKDNTAYIPISRD
ncbi:hypothetical protein ACFSKU_08950 [Pontibacter silvestris]|uniref:Uncharacterized protein n=1 Tax=Pontibacter silvestris TaxID=2305183 RepID=A0ABW4WYC1_9BACT|nr:hypothetical protein [Pontibacter silvestris]MCC9138862.1 hypothetical protein [Pontibacter silvestris]